MVINKFIFLTVLTFSFSTSFSQSLSYINSGGGASESENYSIEFSIGSFQASNYTTDDFQIIRSLFGSADIVALTGVQDSIANNIFLYPNPTRGIIKLKSKLNIDMMSIHNSEMKEIKRFEVVPDEVNLSSEPSGLYFIGIVTKERLLYLKVIKE